MDLHRNRGHRIIKEVIEFLHSQTSLKSCLISPQCYGKSIRLHSINGTVLLISEDKDFTNRINNEPVFNTLLLEQNLKIQEIQAISTFLFKISNEKSITDFFAISGSIFSYDRENYQSKVK